MRGYKRSASLRRKVPMVSLTTVSHERCDLAVSRKENNMLSTHGRKKRAALAPTFTSSILF